MIQAFQSGPKCLCSLEFKGFNTKKKTTLSIKSPEKVRIFSEGKGETASGGVSAVFNACRGGGVCCVAER